MLLLFILCLPLFVHLTETSLLEEENVADNYGVTNVPQSGTVGR